MLLGHWYLVQPGLARAPILEQVRWAQILWVPETIVFVIPTGMWSVLNGDIDGTNGLLGWFWVHPCWARGADTRVSACAQGTPVLRRDGGHRSHVPGDPHRLRADIVAACSSRRDPSGEYAASPTHRYLPSMPTTGTTSLSHLLSRRAAENHLARRHVEGHPRPVRRGRIQHPGARQDGWFRDASLSIRLNASNTTSTSRSIWRCPATGTPRFPSCTTTRPRSGIADASPRPRRIPRTFVHFGAVNHSCTIYLDGDVLRRTKAATARSPSRSPAHRRRRALAGRARRLHPQARPGSGNAHRLVQFRRSPPQRRPRQGSEHVHLQRVAHRWPPTARSSVKSTSMATSHLGSSRDRRTRMVTGGHAQRALHRVGNGRSRTRALAPEVPLGCTRSSSRRAPIAWPTRSASAPSRREEATSSSMARWFS